MTTDEVIEERQASPYEQAHALNSETAHYGLDVLRINRLSLMHEAKLNRKLAAQHRGMQRWHLNKHRTGRLREEARAAHLAWGFLLGHDYTELEGPNTRTPVPRDAVRKKVMMSIPSAAINLDSWLPET